MPDATSPPEEAAAFVLACSQRMKPRAWRQGARVVPLPCGPGEALAELARVHVFQLAEPAARALCAWSLAPAQALLYRAPLSPVEVLALQARGRRCVSLLAEEEAVRYGGALPFACHDLCHLGKFTEPAHYAGQVGFFARLLAASRCAAWEELDRALGPAWVHDRDHVLADMNGASVFLWAALRAKLRLWSQRAGLRPEETLPVLLGALGLSGAWGEAARASLPADREAAERLQHLFTDEGAEILTREGLVPAQRAGVAALHDFE